MLMKEARAKGDILPDTLHIEVKTRQHRSMLEKIPAGWGDCCLGIFQRDGNILCLGLVSCYTGVWNVKCHWAAHQICHFANL